MKCYQFLAVSFLFTALFLLSAGCDLGIVREPYDGPRYDWVQPGHELRFDFRPISDTLERADGFRYDDTDEALIVRIRRHPTDEDRFRLGAGSGSWDRLIRPLYSGLEDLTIQRTAEGLDAIECRECGCGAFFQWTISFLRVPVHPEVGASYPQYACEGKVDETLYVEAVAKEVTVPAGTFETFVLYSPSERRREYWSEAEGIIKIERYRGSNLLGVYELASKNF